MNPLLFTLKHSFQFNFMITFHWHVRNFQDFSLKKDFELFLGVLVVRIQRFNISGLVRDLFGGLWVDGVKR